MPTKEAVEGMRDTLIALGPHSERFYNRLSAREVEGFYRAHMEQAEEE